VGSIGVVGDDGSAEIAERFSSVEENRCLEEGMALGQTFGSVEPNVPLRLLEGGLN
jgi:hypothetical protein